jgi:hypothetical protein
LGWRAVAAILLGPLLANRLYQPLWWHSRVSVNKTLQCRFAVANVNFLSPVFLSGSRIDGGCSELGRNLVKFVEEGAIKEVYFTGGFLARVHAAIPSGTCV